MKTNKGFIGIGMLIAIIVAALAVGGGVTYYVTRNSNNVVVDNSQQIPQNNISNTQTPTNTNHSPAVACAPTDRPWVKVASPNGGEVFNAGQQITVTWTSCNAIAPMSIILIKHDSSVPYTQTEGQHDYAGFTLGGISNYTGTPNDGTQQITLPLSSDTHLTLGQHYSIIVAGQDDPSIGSGFNARDMSDDLFTINSAPANNRSPVSMTQPPFIGPTWPLVVQTATTAYSCTPTTPGTDTDTIQKIINGRTFCVTTLDGSGAGSIRMRYQYVTANGTGTKTLNFSVELTNGCTAYDVTNPQYSTCLNTQTAYHGFNPDTFADSLM